MNRQERRAERARKRKMKGTRHSIADAIEQAKRMHQAGRLNDAEKLYRRIINASPDHADALNYLGILLHQSNRSEKAIVALKRAVSVSPDYADAYNNLGIVYKELEWFDQASEAFDTCLELSPGHFNALNNYGTVFRAQEQYETAISYYRHALSIHPDFTDARINLGYSLYKLSRIDEAFATYLKAIELKPYDPSAYKSLCMMLYVEKRSDEAIDLLNQWLEIDPENPTAQHMYAAFSGENVPAKASELYIKQTFDSFASTFDSVLRDLDYCAPQLVANAVETLIEDKSRKLDMLDAGCGTGLIAPLVSDHARSIVGVDLSREMVNRARGLEIYDELHVEELTRFMRSHHDQYEMILSVDVLIYFGELTEIFQAANCALKAGGYLITTMEEIIDPKPGERIHLNPHGRYSHSRDYVKSCLAEAGLVLISSDQAVLRKEAGEAVTGMVVTSKKP